MDPSVAMSARNRTGIGMSPIDSQQMIDAAQATPPSSQGDASALAALDSAYIEEAEPVGSVPLPGTLKGVAQATLGKLTGKNPEVLIDKLGERLAFERTGTRLYDYLINKCETTQADSGISIDTLRRFRREEAQHFKLVAKALESLGADPTAQTPGADVGAVASSGVLQVLSDPRTSVSQSLEAILTAELVDNAGWELLFKLAGQMGLYDMETEFRVALMEEENHLMQIRQWYEQSALAEAGVAVA
jgi:ferritin-like protein